MFLGEFDGAEVLFLQSMGRWAVQRERAKQNVLLFPVVVGNQENLSESKAIFFGSQINCMLSYKIYPEEESKGKGCNLIG